MVCPVIIYSLFQPLIIFFFLEKNKRRYLDIMSKLLCSIQRKWIVIYIYKWQTLYSKSSHEKGWETDEIEVIHWKSYPQFENLIFSHVKYIWKSVVSVLTCIKAVFFLYLFSWKQAQMTFVRILLVNNGIHFGSSHKTILLLGNTVIHEEDQYVSVKTKSQI